MANNPPKGSKTKVMPIQQIKDIKTVKKMLANELRNHALFVVGINITLRASDLSRLTVDQVQHLKPGDMLKIDD